MMHTAQVKVLTLLCATMMLGLPGVSIAAQFNSTGRVVHVNDGDTIVVLINGDTQMNVRMSSIDAPETAHTKQDTGRIGQPYSAKSAEHLSFLVKNQTVDLRCFEADRWARQVCEVFLAGTSVNREMVAAGWAWANRSAKGRYLRDRGLLALEDRARASGAGLWAGNSPIPPWEWRQLCWVQGHCK